MNISSVNKTASIKKRYITSDPMIMGGMPVIAGTRIPIARILFLLKEGYLVDTIASEFPWVDRKKIEGAIDELIKDLGNNDPKIYQAQTSIR